MSRAQEIRQSDPQEPDTLARLAGKDMYGTIVGGLRRVELYRLGNAWGMSFPVGASKDFMLRFFMQLEAEGKNPFHPPGMALSDTAQLRARNVTFGDVSHAETVEIETVAPATQPLDEFTERLEGLPHGQLKKICKVRGIPQTRKDKKQDLVARILAASEGNSLEQDTT